MIDEAWKEHLREMDELRHSVQNASYENKDPLLIYKLESYNLFKNMVDAMNRKTVAVLMRGQIPVRREPTEEERQAMAARQEALAKQAAEAIAQERARIQQQAQQQAQKQAQQEQQAQDAIEIKEAEEENATQEENSDESTHPDPIRAEKRVGRNDLCPCGSGKKYKNCHGQGL